ncbi:hypothetical protein FGO68_gene571 [Halteria grandinella]|uniref:Uncharacterized protein n=1 Tax=Halteria grandinella TaxID=5974 RepID=A0A8J8T1A5_HALGN|nr:hypothetical protein FGO68_gene571 [Halteria grandinella]
MLDQRQLKSVQKNIDQERSVFGYVFERGFEGYANLQCSSNSTMHNTSYRGHNMYQRSLYSLQNLQKPKVHQEIGLSNRSQQRYRGDTTIEKIMAQRDYMSNSNIIDEQEKLQNLQQLFKNARLLQKLTGQNSPKEMTLSQNDL